MHTLEILNKYLDIIQKIFRSRLMLQIMISLGEGDKTLAELRGLTGSTSQTILPKIRFLEGIHHIRFLDNAYHLTPQGEVISSQIRDYIRTTILFSKNPKFWSTHYLKAIPPTFLRDIGDLYNSGIVETSSTNIYSVLECFFEMLEDTEHIHIISSFMSHPHADALIAKVKAGVPVEMVVNAEIAEELRNEPFRSKMEEIAGSNHFRIYVALTPLLIGLTVTDSTLSFGMCMDNDLKYDISSDLFSTDRLAVAWGERLFSYYKDLSEEFSII